MENKNVVVVKHHPRPITLANSFYTTQCPDIADRIVINLTSRNPDRAFAQQVSPFYVGPVTCPDGASSGSLEIFWQVGKVFPHHDDGGQPSEAYFQYRDNMYSKKMGEIPKPVMRHPYREFGYEADDRYNVTLGRHYHITCRHCGAVADVTTEVDECALLGITKGCENFTVDGLHLEFSGVCENCQTKFEN